VAEAEAAECAAGVADAQIDLEDTVLRAPSDGVVLERLKAVGEMAVPGGLAGSGDLIRLANVEELRAEVDVNEAEVAKLSLGQPAEVAADAATAQRYLAHVVKLSPHVNRQKGTVTVALQLVDGDARLRPDTSVRVAFLATVEPAGAEAPGVTVPRSALRAGSGGPFVWVVREGRSHRQAVGVVGEAGDASLVGTGLSGGESLVVGDAAGLADGRIVEAVEHQ